MDRLIEAAPFVLTFADGSTATLPDHMRGDPGNIDVARLRGVLEWATEQATPELMPWRRTHARGWDQAAWAVCPVDPTTQRRGECQTSFCLAGYTVAQSPDHQLAWRLDPDSDRWRGDFTVRYERVQDVARGLLGLTIPQSMELFAFANTLGRLWQLAALFTEGAIEPPANMMIRDHVRDMYAPMFHSPGDVAAEVLAVNACRALVLAENEPDLPVSHVVKTDPLGGIVDWSGRGLPDLPDAGFYTWAALETDASVENVDMADAPTF